MVQKKSSPMDPNQPCCQKCPFIHNIEHMAWGKDTSIVVLVTEEDIQGATKNRETFRESPIFHALNKFPIISHISLCTYKDNNISTTSVTCVFCKDKLTFYKLSFKLTR